MGAGVLYIAATPIGNLEDITLRALRILKEEVTSIYCEDTRQSRKLLDAYNITAKTKSLHAHSADARIKEACLELSSGANVAYISDAGTPGISDPGSKLAAAARAAGIKVIPLPGASALTALVSAAGFSSKNILFAGFLSKKPGTRIHELERLAGFSGVIVVYESPYRIKKLIEAIAQVFPSRQIVIGREMTKFFEEFITGSAEEILKNADTIAEKGEFAVAINNDI